MFRHRLITWTIVLVTSTLTGCAGSATPQLIGAHPKGGQPTLTPPRTDLLVVSNAYLDLEVADPDAAVRRATQLAYDLGGYLVGSQSWYEADRKYFTLTLAVPVSQFEAARSALVGFGYLLAESVSGDLVILGDGRNEWNTFSHITVQFRPSSTSIQLPSWPSLGWNPVRTFQRAFGVFASIFAFLVDGIIWMTVLLGPFVLMGLGLRVLIRLVSRKEKAP